MVSARRVLFVARRRFLLRALTVLLAGEVALVGWLVSLAPQSEWRDAVGDMFWWALPAGLIGLSLVLPLSFLWLHGRYVLRLEVADDTVLISTFLLWGQRERVWDRRLLATAQAADFPMGTRPEVPEFSTGTPLRFRVPDQRIDLVIDRQGGEFPAGEDALIEIFGGNSAASVTSQGWKGS
ncbi:MAG TPA: hypothetical protein VHO24_11060 [Opitutaceae bacterium]|nr:hypothetical protein [Opitutaceae bacterium]